MLQVDRHFFVADRVILRTGHLFYDVASQGERFGDCKASAVTLNGIYKSIGLVIDLEHSAFQRCASRETVDGVVVFGLLPNLDLSCNGSVLPLNLRSGTIGCRQSSARRPPSTPRYPVRGRSNAHWKDRQHRRSRGHR